MDVGDYLRVVRKGWVVVVAALVIGVAAAASWAFTRTPAYESTSELFVSSQGGSSITEQQQGNTYTQARVASYVQLASTPKVLDPVIADLDLSTSAVDLAEDITVASSLDTTIVRIAATDPDPLQAARIADAVADSLTEAIYEVETLPDTDTSPINVTMVREAIAADAPVSPNVPLTLVLGAVVGLAAGIALALVRAVLDTRIRSGRDVVALTTHPLIGHIPLDPRARTHPLVLREDPRSPRSESFRTLRTNLEFVDLDGGHSFVVTSAVPGEGKSTTAANVAIALAEGGKRVVLLDADLRKPKLADYFGIEGGVGLTDVLVGRVEANDVLQDWGGHPLRIMPAGTIPPNPSELLGSTRLQDLLEALANDADIVLLDAPPLLPVTDAAVLARRVSGAILVVGVGSTHRAQLVGALEALATVGARVAGIVLSKVPTRGPDAYGAGYGYGYASGPTRTAGPARRGTGTAGPARRRTGASGRARHGRRTRGTDAGTRVGV